MAIRNILRDGDEALHKRCRPVEEYNERLWQLLDDMAETMRAAEGAGLAAPQVGILRRVFVMDVGNGLIEAVNPEIIAVKGTQEDVEGCLS
ncbi:MAG: peptide deformylase, partial [Oscillospiraceae bacterium]|nr:peptide deformylase [Oscillospiraceae bacterium]